MDNIPHESLDRSPPDHLPPSCPTPHYHLQEIHLDNANFSWFSNGSDLKGENGKYFGYVIATPFEVIEAAPSHLANLAQQVELLRSVCWPRAKMQISILMIGMSLEQLTTLGCYGNSKFLHISRTKLKGPFGQELLDAIFLPADLAIIKIPEPPNWSSWRIKEPPY